MYNLHRKNINMGSQQSIQRCNFEDIQSVIQERNGYLINTLADTEQSCLIDSTIHSKDETKLINQLLQSNKNIKIIVYGKHSDDTSVHKKYEQLIQLGFTNVFIYSGGLFQWMCLQDIYGQDEFRTTTQELDILRFKPPSISTKNLLLH